MVGTEIVLAFPLPSSSENLNDGSDASIGITAVASESILDPEITCAPMLADSIVAKGRFTLGPVTERSLLFFGAVPGCTPAVNSLDGEAVFGATGATSFGAGCGTTGLLSAT